MTLTIVADAGETTIVNVFEGVDSIRRSLTTSAVLNFAVKKQLLRKFVCVCVC